MRHGFLKQQHHGRARNMSWDYPRSGKRHQVCFDATKEAFVIFSKTKPCGREFKQLGATIDPKLIMDEEINRIRLKPRAKVKAILRTRRFYSVGEMIQQYKTRVLCLIEGTIGAYFHAASTHLASLGEIQRRFCEEVGLDEQRAFWHWIWFPWSCDRILRLWASFTEFSSTKRTMISKCCFRVDAGAQLSPRDWI